MRVTNSDLDDTVVEDGETTIIPKSETKSVSAKCQGVKGAEQKQETSSEQKTEKRQNGLVAAMGKKREPVEDTYDGEDSNSNTREVDSLAATLGSCTISPPSGDASQNLEKQLAGLSVKDKEEDDKDSEEFKSASVITVDPPSLPHEEEEETCESSESLDLESRGPTAGKPAAFRPGNDAYNHVAQKAYYSHNIDKFQQGSMGMQHQYGPPQNGYNFASTMSQPFNEYSVAPGPAYNMNNFNGTMTSGKRGIDDDADNPFKYTRPVEEVRPAYYQQQQQMNDLSMGGRTTRPTYTVSQTLGSGGQVTDNSPDILSPTTEACGFRFSQYDTQFSLTDVDNMLEALDQQPAQKQTTEYDPGYSSENSPHSENMGSPGSSPKSTFSPQRPPSNMSHDSGVPSPYTEDSIQSAVHSPASDYNRAAECGVMPSPCPPGSVGQYQGSPAAYMSPRSVMSDDYSMTSAPSPGNEHPDLDMYFAEHHADLKDALEVVAWDIQQQNKKRAAAKVSNVKPAPVNGMVTPNVNGSMPAPAANMVPQGQPALPVTMAMPSPQQQQQQVTAEGRPNKLPIPALSKNNAAPKPVTQPTSMPVMVVNSTVAQPGHPGSNVVPATTSQSVLMIPNGQAAQSIIVLVNPTPPQQPQKKQFVPIRPKIPSTTTSISTTSDPSSAAKTEVTSAKTSPIMHSTQNNVNSTATNGNPGAQATSCMQPPPAQSPSGRKSANQNRNSQQPKMLNVARRLVAAMTTDDILFKDNEGDTYLHVSVCKADRNLVQALLERMTRERMQGMVNAQNSKRETPLYLAVSSNHPEMVELLISYGADVNLFAEDIRPDGRSKEVKAPLHCAVSNGDEYLPTLQSLLASPDLKIDILNSEGHTPLHCAILEHGKQRLENEVVNNLPIIEALIKHGASLDAQDQKNGKTALMYALESRNIALIEHVVTLVDPTRLRQYLRTPAFDSSTCMKILEYLQRDMLPEHRQRLQTCLKLNGSRRDN